MELLFDIIWVIGFIAFTTFGVLGFRTIPELQRFFMFSGLLVSSMVAAAQGLVMFIGFVWMFPIGLRDGFLQLRGITINSPSLPTEALIAGWITYVIAGLGYIFTQNATVRRLIWATLAVVLLANIGGCHKMVSSIKSI